MDRGGEPDIMPFSEVVDTGPLGWLWQGYLPLGRVIGFIGNGGIGKSLLMVDLAARVSAGLPMPDGTPSVKGGVLILTRGEDSASAIKQRLRAAGADISRVYCRRGDTWEFPRDAKRLRRLLVRYGIVLVIIDPIKEFTPSAHDRDEISIRRCISPFSDIVEETNAVIILIRHIGKKQGQDAGFMGIGSVSWRNVVRGEYAAGRDPDDSSRLLFANDKLNDAATPLTLAWRIRSISQTVAVIEWEGVSPRTADDLFIKHQSGPQKRDDAEDFLRNYLANGARPARKVHDAALVLGHTERTLQRARKVLSVKSYQAKRVWMLELP